MTSEVRRNTPLETVLKRDRAIVGMGLVGLAALAWSYTAYRAWAMNSANLGTEMVMPRTQSWGAVDSLLMFVMWAVMMTAMMVPAATPMILMFATVNRKRRDEQRPYVPITVFLLGYLVVWAVLAALATLVQWGLHTASLLSPSIATTSSILGGAILIAAGIFQWTPLKHLCLTQCRSPLSFIMSEWREGPRGALIMGMRHGEYCVGCCWILMGLLFVAGVMNLLWVAAIGAFVLIERIVPRGPLLSRTAGLALIGWGAWMLARVAL